MLSRLMLLFVAVPLVELALLLMVGQRIGAGLTVALVVATGIGGAALARQQGLRAVRAVQEELAAGQLPGRAMLDALAVLVGGALLLTPGILTDLAGFGLVLPFSRGWLRSRIQRSLEARMRAGQVQFSVFGPGGAARTGTADVGTRPGGGEP